MLLDIAEMPPPPLKHVHQKKRIMIDITSDKLGAPKIVDRGTFQTEPDALRAQVRSEES
jgi:hypothetical protein